MLRRIRRILFWAIGVPLGILAIGAAAFVGYVLYLSWQTPSINTLHPRPETQNSVVYAADGTRLGFIPAAQLRQQVPSSSIPATMKQAIVAIEDRRFYQHKGVDYKGILRAAVKDVTTGAAVQGGSTITMQLVRQLYLNHDKTFRRKIEEATLAKEMEKRRSKDWILSSYLNDVSFGTAGGQEAVGVQAAARVFFGKPASSLNLTESALLAGLPQAPTLYNPILHPAAAKARRSEVLEAMVRAGMIAPSVAARINRHGLGLHPSDYYTHRRERHFFDFVERELRDRVGVAAMERGGLRIYTTLDLKLQRAARRAIRQNLNRPHDPAAAVVSIDSRNGDIKAMATSAKYENEQFDYASQGHRQPGSTFKPIVLLAAIDEHSVDPKRTYYVSKPLNMNTGFGPVHVQTYDHTYGGRMNLVRATLLSDNTVYEQLDLDIGPDVVSDTAANMGIDTPLNGYPAEGLGGLTEGVTPLELTRAYATLANGGNRLDTTGIKQVVYPDGHTVVMDGGNTDSLFKDGETATVTKILQQNMKHGTGRSAQIGCPAAGKTGTTDTFRDAWFAGYTPRLATVVWVGYPHKAIPMTDVHGIKVAGATFPAFIWRDFMKVAKGSFCGKFPKPVEPVQLKPYCGRLTVTNNCAPPPSEVGPSETAPVEATGGAPQSTTTTTVPAPVPVPDTAIVGTPPSQTTARSAVFRFSAQTAPARGFECSIDGAAFSGCSSPATYSRLAPGQHVFSVRALSTAGQPDSSPATYSWSVFEDLVPQSQQHTNTTPAPAPKPKKKKKPQQQQDQSPPTIVG
jgi:penicillin-binding protein 1A